MGTCPSRSPFWTWAAGMGTSAPSPCPGCPTWAWTRTAGRFGRRSAEGPTAFSSGPTGAAFPSRTRPSERWSATVCWSISPTWRECWRRLPGCSGLEAGSTSPSPAPRFFPFSPLGGHWTGWACGRWERRTVPSSTGFLATITTTLRRVEGPPGGGRSGPSGGPTLSFLPGAGGGRVGALLRSPLAGGEEGNRTLGHLRPAGKSLADGTPGTVFLRGVLAPGKRLPLFRRGPSGGGGGEVFNLSEQDAGKDGSFRV